MPVTPTVLYPLTLAGLLHYVLTTQTRPGTASTLLVVCSSRDMFMHQLAQSLQHRQGDMGRHGDVHDMTSPSLHNLLTTRHVRLAFCASVQALLAYLTVLSGQNVPAHSPRLVLVNPLALHASTMAFSAQRLSRCFAVAIETALRLGAVLEVAECLAEGEDVAVDSGRQEHTSAQQDPWEQQVPILNASARRFGFNSGGERAWAGRTVQAKRIAARWFRFQNLGDQQTCEVPG